jgi:class 3 adenylate cyclase
VPDDIFDILHPPGVVIFAGQPLDLPGMTPPSFPPGLEGSVKQAIQKSLDVLQADIGYCSASAGSDLLFIEAMLEREAEVHVFLPCSAEDFVHAQVEAAGRVWERRFRNALKLATTVNYVTHERLLGHRILFRFNNQVIEGMARLRAGFLGTEPRLMLVWDYAADQTAGTAADFMDQWPDIKTLHLIQLDELRESHPVESAPTERVTVFQAGEPEPPTQPDRVIKTMLFADIVGFSKLQEEHLPQLWRFLEDMKAVLSDNCPQPDLIESWGDALYVVMPNARSMLQFAFNLQYGFAIAEPQRYSFPDQLQVRIGLHAGPVFEGQHPLTGRDIIYGAHVSRAARIEPITVPGQIYASQQFVALLTAEDNAFRHKQEMTGQPYQKDYHCEYVGNQPLAKNYGNQPVYHLRQIGS